MVRGLSFVVGLFCVSLVATAQTGPSLLIDPWSSDPQWASTTDELVFINGGHDKRSDRDMDIFYWDSEGRIKFDRENASPDFWLGYRILTMDVSSGVRGLPDNLNDVSLVGAFKIGECEDWVFSGMVGMGSANDGHFSNEYGLYAIANLNATRTLNERSKLHIGVNYHGNRTFLPDVPLPYAMYETKVNDELSVRLGLPGSGVVWRPLEPLVLRAEWKVPFTFNAQAAWWFSEKQSVFLEYKRSYDAFYIDGAERNRLFYDSNRVAAGVRVIFGDLLDATMGLGYAFDQEFARGYDVRDTRTFVEPSDEVFLFFMLQGIF